MAGEVENISPFVFRTLLFYLKFLATIFVISWADMKVLFGIRVNKGELDDVKDAIVPSS